MMQKLILLLLSMMLTGPAMVRDGSSLPAPLTAPEAAKLIFRRDAIAFAGSAKRLHLTVIMFRPEDPGTLTTSVAALKDCRLKYKKIESFLSWFFPGVAAGIDGPPVPEGEEPFMEFQAPRGLQVMETLLTGRNDPASRQRLLQEAALLTETAATLPALMYQFTAGETGIMQSLRLGMIRVATLGIAGYDAPELKTGLQESAVVTAGIREQLELFPGTADLIRGIETITRRLNTASDFNAFDRLDFIRTAVIPFQAALRSYCERRGIPLPDTGLLRAGFTDIYARGALRPAVVYPAADALIGLGKKWFRDPALSRGKVRSCESCHQPGRYFTDGLTVSAGLNGRKPLERNTPTLLYSAYQYREAWDGKAAGVYAQIFNVLHDPREMDIDTTMLQRSWNEDPGYRAHLAGLFPGSTPLSPSEMICTAVGAYVSTLGGFNSEFDRYLQGEDSLMKPEARRGFNLFMGKARCGSCHFAPLFNGTLPPLFDRTEFEIPGTLQNTDFNHPVLSRDAGRYDVYPLPFNLYSFKSPTVRNAFQTAPYMHNGRYKNLESLLTFYNNGGGAGMGLNVPGQTLSSDSLHLAPQEMKDIIAFISALTDKTESIKK